MTIESHLETLVKKHGALENEITEALAHPSIDDIVLTDLKRKKLQLKEQIERIKRDHTRH
ncbi:MAG: YdcH family protein [Rhizobiaceae bacterium]